MSKPYGLPHWDHAAQIKAVLNAAETSASVTRNRKLERRLRGGIATIERQQRELRRLGQIDKFLEEIEARCLDLRSVSVPTGGDDYDVAWVVIEHYMAEPHEREIGRGPTPLDALRSALGGGA